MDVLLTNHALFRWYERIEFFDYSKTQDEIIHEIKHELENSVKTSKKNGDVIYKTEKITFVTITKDNHIKIITLFPKEIKFTYDENAIIKTKMDITKEELKTIESIIASDDYKIFKHMGSKKLIILDDYIVLMRIETYNNKRQYQLYGKWNIQELYDISRYNEFKNYFFDNLSLLDYEELEKQINIREYIYKHEKLKKDELPEEIVIYKEVLDGTRDMFPHRYWEDDIGGESFIAAKLCVQYLFEDILKWDIVQIYNNFSAELFKKYKLNNMVTKLFQANAYLALDNAYPNTFRPYLFKKYSGLSWYWQLENDGVLHAQEAIQWLLDESEKDGYKISENNLLSFNWIDLLKKYKLISIFNITFNQNWKEFFNTCFYTNFDEMDVVRYDYQLKNGLRTKYIKTHM